MRKLLRGFNLPFQISKLEVGRTEQQKTQQELQTVTNPEMKFQVLGDSHKDTEVLIST